MVLRLVRRFISSKIWKEITNFIWIWRMDSSFEKEVWHGALYHSLCDIVPSAHLLQDSWASYPWERTHDKELASAMYPSLQMVGWSHWPPQFGNMNLRVSFPCLLNSRASRRLSVADTWDCFSQKFNWAFKAPSEKPFVLNLCWPLESPALISHPY